MLLKEDFSLRKQTPNAVTQWEAQPHERTLLKAQEHSLITLVSKLPESDAPGC